MGADLATGAQVPSPGFATVIPKPLAQAPERGAFELGAGARILVRSTTPEALRVARLLAAKLRPATGYRLPVSTVPGDARAGSVELVLDPGDRTLGTEGYRVVVAPAGVTVSARTGAGLFWGTQTLRQLLPAAIEARARRPGPWRIPLGVIHDRPRFAWRGLMLDVARHFFGVGEVKRVVDLMVLYKLNRLHLHLTDDQGWRIAIRSWPRLSSHGSRTAVGGGPGGRYTQREYAAIVSYARERFVEVVPEVDMPGHVNAALSSYGRLACDGVAPAPYTGIEVGFSSLCIRKEETYAFVDDVVRELSRLTPGAYLHVGGDEAHSTDPGDYAYFVDRVQRIARRHGKRMIAWEEASRASLHRTSIAQHWQSPELARRAVAQGARLIMSPATKAYLDMKYTRRTPIGLTWAGTTSVRDAYEWDPATQVDGVSERDVLGVEAPLWSETVETRAHLDHLVFPRLLGHAEVAWSRAEGRSWTDYRRRLAAQGERLAALDVGYHRSPEIRWR
ncbi:MAG TPA: beta-N-acetylhexosaminidase [Gaiella sp.]|nr:beta-N-acetylhexosaminidase [Gaiella sp.]